MKLKSVLRTDFFPLTVVHLTRLWSTFGSIQGEGRADETLLESLCVQFFLHPSGLAVEKLAHQANVAFISAHISRRICWIESGDDISKPLIHLDYVSLRWRTAF